MSTYKMYQNDRQSISVTRSRCNLTPEFWVNFAKNHWEKEEFVQNDTSIVPPMSADVLFEIVVDMSDLQIAAFERSEGDVYEVKMYIGNSTTPLSEGYFHLYPKKEDGNFAAYSKRVQRELDGQEFSFVIDGLVMSPESRAWTKEFLKGMYQPLKAISYGHFWSIFFGSYTTTPGGVHDHANYFFSESAFYFPLRGNKQMLTWRPDYVAQHPELKESSDYFQHKAASRLLSTDPGGMMYWPSDRWHIGSSGGGDVSMVLAVRTFSNGVYSFLQALDEGLFVPYMRWRWMFPLYFYWIKFIGRSLEKLLELSSWARARQIRAFPFDPDDLQASAAKIPDEVRKSSKPFAFMFGKKLEHALSLFWLAHLSTLGMTVIQLPLPAIKPEPSLRLKRNVDAIILWRQVDEQTILVVSDVIFNELPVCFLPLVKYVVSMSEGDVLVFSDLIEMAKKINVQPQDEQLIQIMSFLVESRSFEQQPKKV